MIPVLYQDDYLVAVNKPAGMLVHRSNLDRYETRFVMQIVRDQLGRHVYPVHRLDKPTSGVLLFGLTSNVARDLSQIFFANAVEKQYCAIVRGYINESGVIDYPLKEELDKIADKKRMKGKYLIDIVSKNTESLIVYGRGKFAHHDDSLE